MALAVGGGGGFLSVCNGLRIFGSFRRFEGLVEDALFLAGVFEAGEYRRVGRWVELADGLAFAMAGVNRAHEGGFFADELAGVLGVGGGQAGVLVFVGGGEAGLHFERLETGIAEQAPLGVDEALDDADFEAVGGGKVRRYSATMSCYSAATSPVRRARPW